MRFLVTGAAGFIGSHLCEALLENPNNEVVGLDSFHDYYSSRIKRNNLSSFLDKENFNFVEGSILDKKTLENIKADAVYHFAAIAGVRHSIQDPLPYFRINVMGTLNMLEAFKHAEKFVLASTSSVYGNVPLDMQPVNEEASPNPLAPYPLSKLHAEAICLQYQKLHSLPVAILRFYTVYGARQRPDEMFTKFIACILKGQKIEVYGDGEQTRDFTHVSDIVNASILAQRKGSRIYNIASGKRVSVNHAISVISAATGKEPQIAYADKQQADAAHTHANISKARKELGYEPRMSFEDGVKDCVSWCDEAVKKGLV